MAIVCRGWVGVWVWDGGKVVEVCVCGGGGGCWGGGGAFSPRIQTSEFYYSRTEILGSSLFLQSVLAKLHRHPICKERPSSLSDFAGTLPYLFYLFPRTLSLPILPISQNVIFTYLKPVLNWANVSSRT